MTVPAGASSSLGTAPAGARPARDPRLDRIALGLLAGATLLHVLYAGLLPLSPQEAYYWAWSRRLDLSYFDHPGLSAWTIRAFTEIFGDSERAIRLAAAFHSAVFGVFLWATARRMLGSRVALWTLGAGLAVPLFSVGQVIITPDGPLLSGWAMALYFTVRALDEDGRWLLAAGAAAGWAMLGKYTGALLLPQILAVLVADPRGRRLLRTPWPWVGAALALLLFSPAVIWNARHAFASFEFQTAERAAASRFRPVLVGRFLGLQMLMASPVAFVLLVEAVVRAWGRRDRAEWRILFWFAAPLMAIAALVSPVHWVKANWLAPAYPAALVAAAALALEEGASRARRIAGLAALAVAVLGSLYLHVAFAGPWLPFPARDDLSAGWGELAGRVEAERAALPVGSFVAGCSYKVSAELAYNLPDRPRTWSSEIAGDHGLEYRIWFDPAELVGRDGIVVLDPREKGTCKRLAEACRPLDPLAPLTVYRGRDEVTTFQLWRCRYAGPPARPGAGPESGP